MRKWPITRKVGEEQAHAQFDMILDTHYAVSGVAILRGGLKNGVLTTRAGTL